MSWIGSGLATILTTAGWLAVGVMFYLVEPPISGWAWATYAAWTVGLVGLEVTRRMRGGRL